MKALPIQTTVYTNLGFGTVTRAFLGGTFYNVTFADGYTCERRHSEVIEVVKGYTESDYKKALKAYDTAYLAFESDTSEFNKTASDFLPKKVTTVKNINQRFTPVCTAKYLKSCLNRHAIICNRVDNNLAYIAKLSCSAGLLGA